VQGGVARFFFPIGYHTTVSLINYVGRRTADIMGIQHNTTKKLNKDTVPTGFSPNFRAKKAADDLRAQIMNLCNGNIMEYNELMKGDVLTYLLKFEMSIKKSKGNGIG
jgi:hypothetical protein